MIPIEKKERHKEERLIGRGRERTGRKSCRKDENNEGKESFSNIVDLAKLLHLHSILLHVGHENHLSFLVASIMTR